MTKKLWVLACLVLALAAIAIGASGCDFFPAPAPKASLEAGLVLSQQNSGIWVNGEGKATAVPDVAMLTLGVEAQEATVAQAQSEASTAMDAIVKQLTGAGVASKDIKTQQFSIYPVRTTNKDTGQQVLIGYRVDNTLTAKIRKVANTGTIIDAVVRAGGDFTTINSISFTVDDPSPYQKDARDKAMADAEAKAKQLADSAGINLGDPTYINESGGSVPITYLQAPVPSAIGVPAPAPPISAGETEITIDVQVVYSIK